MEAPLSSQVEQRGRDHADQSSAEATNPRAARRRRAVVAALVLGAAAAVWFARVKDSVAGSYLMGYALHADCSHTDLGTIRAGEKVMARTKARNIRSRPTTIIGVETSCDCANAKIDDLPLTLQPWEEHRFVMTVEASKRDKPVVVSAHVDVDVELYKGMATDYISALIHIGLTTVVERIDRGDNSHERSRCKPRGTTRSK